MSENRNVDRDTLLTKLGGSLAPADRILSYVDQAIDHLRDNQITKIKPGEFYQTYANTYVVVLAPESEASINDHYEMLQRYKSDEMMRLFNNSIRLNVTEEGVEDQTPLDTVKDRILEAIQDTFEKGQKKEKEERIGLFGVVTVQGFYNQDHLTLNPGYDYDVTEDGVSQLNYGPIQHMGSSFDKWLELHPILGTIAMTHRLMTSLKQRVTPIWEDHYPVPRYIPVDI